MQFARGVTDHLEYAIKFFVSEQAFDEEGEFYRKTAIGSLLPKCIAFCANARGQETDAHDIPLPPFLVMEKGESLDEWNHRAKPDIFQAVAVRTCLFLARCRSLGACPEPRTDAFPCCRCLKMSPAVSQMCTRQAWFTVI